jgi:hypothetical protein
MIAIGTTEKKVKVMNENKQPIAETSAVAGILLSYRTKLL